MWKRVRTAYKGVRDADKLATELPDSQLGVLLLMYIKQVRTAAGRVWPHWLGIHGVRCEHGQLWRATMPASQRSACRIALRRSNSCVPPPLGCLTSGAQGGPPCRRLPGALQGV